MGGNIQLYRNSDNFVHFIWRIFSGFVDRLTRRMPLVEQELLTLPRASGFTPCIQWCSRYSIFSFIRMFCRLLFVLFYFFFWPLCCLFLFDIRILITPLVSSNSSSASLECIVSWYTVFYLYIDSQQLCGRLYYIVLYRYSIFDSLNERMINLIRNIESERSCIGVLGLLIYAFSTIFLLYFETVPTVWHLLFLILF